SAARAAGARALSYPLLGRSAGATFGLRFGPTIAKSPSRPLSARPPPHPSSASGEFPRPLPPRRPGPFLGSVLAYAPGESPAGEPHGTEPSGGAAGSAAPHPADPDGHGLLGLETSLRRGQARAGGSAGWRPEERCGTRRRDGHAGLGSPSADADARVA